MTISVAGRDVAIDPRAVARAARAEVARTPRA